VLFYRVENIGKFEMQIFRLHNQTFHFLAEQLTALVFCGGTVFADKSTNSRANFQNVILDKRRNDFMSRVGVDAKLLTEGSHGRKGIPRTQSATNDGFLHRINHLF